MPSETPQIGKTTTKKTMMKGSSRIGAIGSNPIPATTVPSTKKKAALNSSAAVYFGALMNSNPLARPLSTVKTILDVSDEAK